VKLIDVRRRKRRLNEKNELESLGRRNEKRKRRKLGWRRRRGSLKRRKRERGRQRRTRNVKRKRLPNGKNGRRRNVKKRRERKRRRRNDKKLLESLLSPLRKPRKRRRRRRPPKLPLPSRNNKLKLQRLRTRTTLALRLLLRLNNRFLVYRSLLPRRTHPLRRRRHLHRTTTLLLVNNLSRSLPVSSLVTPRCRRQLRVNNISVTNKFLLLVVVPLVSLRLLLECLLRSFNALLRVNNNRTEWVKVLVCSRLLLIRCRCLNNNSSSNLIGNNSKVLINRTTTSLLPLLDRIFLSDLLLLVLRTLRSRLLLPQEVYRHLVQTEFLRHLR
jgi:hypothetical protein